jgi:organic hydroperoxide reductase OsmC/OhrA
MQALPHHYNVTVAAAEKGPAEITSHKLMPLTSAPPLQFEGPGDLWSPETLVVAAVADCLVLTFKAIAKPSKLQWNIITCDADGTVDRSEGVTRFTAMRLRARLVLPAGADHELAQRVLEKAEKACLVGNSLKCERVLEVEITTDAESATLAPCT